MPVSARIGFPVGWCDGGVSELGLAPRLRRMQLFNFGEAIRSKRRPGGLGDDVSAAAAAAGLNASGT
jgi:hypothetical protein